MRKLQALAGIAAALGLAAAPAAAERGSYNDWHVHDGGSGVDANGLVHRPAVAGAALDPSNRDRAEAQPAPGFAQRPKLSRCTMAFPPTRTTVEAQLANAADFCELVSQALAGDVFHAPMVVTPGRLWHYPDAALSCHLRYGNTSHRMTVRNSTATCRWLRRHAPEWHQEATTTGVPRSSLKA